MYCPVQGLSLQPSDNQLETLAFNGDFHPVDSNKITQWSSIKATATLSPDFACCLICSLWVFTEHRFSVGLVWRISFRHCSAFHFGPFFFHFEIQCRITEDFYKAKYFILFQFWEFFLFFSFPFHSSFFKV